MTAERAAPHSTPSTPDAAGAAPAAAGPPAPRAPDPAPIGPGMPSGGTRGAEPPVGTDTALPPGTSRRRLAAEVWIVLALSLGQSGVYAVISLIAKLTQGPLSSQRATLNESASPRPYVDLTYQLAGIAFTLVPVALVLWLLAGDRTGTPVTRRLGLDLRRPLADLGSGALLAAVIGIPGLALYVVGHAFGITATIVPEALNAYWWTLPVLVLQAVKNAVLEEVIVVGYLLDRLRRLGFGPWASTGLSAVLRGSYHLYQGFGPFLGNAIMGVVFAQWYLRKGRVMPLIVAHTILDTVSFVGYDLARPILHLP